MSAVPAPLRALGRPVGAIAGGWLLAVLAAAVLAPLLTPYAYDVQALTEAYQPYSGAHWLGTDEFGRDLLTRLIYGARTSLSVSATAITLSVACGMTLGAAAAWFGGWLDRAVTTAVDLTWSFPEILIALILVAIIGPGTTGTMIAIAVAYLAQFARLTRAQIMTLKGETFIEAARSLGAGNAHILFRHLLPNALAPVLVSAMLATGDAIILEATLGFFGLGAQPPVPSWGGMMSAGSALIFKAPWIIIFPGLTVALTVVAINLYGDALIAELDIRSKLARRSMTALLQLDGVGVAIGAVALLDGIDLRVERGQILGLVGESGSGKSLTAMAAMGLLPLIGGRITGGAVRFDGRDMGQMSETQRRALRGRRIGFVTQNPMTALDPVQRIGAQIDVVSRLHLGLSQPAARARTLDLMTQLRIPEAAAVAEAWPHELSGGMKQRIVIAMALAGEPDLIIADEPTTALDVTVQAQIIQILGSLVRDRGLALLLITHDMGVVAQVCDRVAVLYAGRLAEEGQVGPIFAAPSHPYTAALIGCIPQEGMASGSLSGIPGAVPSPASFPQGCRFHPRCPRAIAVCRTTAPPLLPHGQGRVACHLAGAAR